MDYNEHNADSPSPLLWTLMISMSIFFYISHRFDHALFRNVTLPYLVVLFFFLWFCLAYVLAEKGFAIPRILSFISLAGIASIPSGISRLVDLLPDSVQIEVITPPIPPLPNPPPPLCFIEATDEDEKQHAGPRNGTACFSSDSDSLTGLPSDDSLPAFSRHAPGTTSSTTSTDGSLPRGSSTQVVCSSLSGARLPSILHSSSPIRQRSSSISLPSSPPDSSPPCFQKFTVPDWTPPPSPHRHTLQWVINGSEESPSASSPPTSLNSLCVESDPTKKGFKAPSSFDASWSSEPRTSRSDQDPLDDNKHLNPFDQRIWKSQALQANVKTLKLEQSKQEAREELRDELEKIGATPEAKLYRDNKQLRLLNKHLNLAYDDKVGISFLPLCHLTI